MLKRQALSVLLALGLGGCVDTAQAEQACPQPVSAWHCVGAYRGDELEGTIDTVVTETDGAVELALDIEGCHITSSHVGAPIAGRFDFEAAATWTPVITTDDDADPCVPVSSASGARVWRPEGLEGDAAFVIEDFAVQYAGLGELVADTIVCTPIAP